MNDNFMTFREFENKITQIKQCHSIRDGIKYTFVRYDDRQHKYVGKRETTCNEFTIDIKKLYSCVCNNYHKHINISVLKEYITNRCQSPAYAILIEAGIISGGKNKKIL